MPQFRLLAYLEQQPGSSLSKVAEYLDVTKATASTTIERLVQSGHVDRSVDPQERRYVRLQLTDHGLQELEAMRQMIRNQLAALLASLPPEQLASIGTSLQILYQIFQPIA
ncbi:MarR family winged helix-turn-helix transcriptional regulator [Alkalinema pantanalense CENA528]|uniref:MarR family winged helix-turn-helix transcriptional regulator n=1 Tax=Alkalinema pantanalense TaxID=1620705 RepID=UPI003D6DBF15